MHTQVQACYFASWFLGLIDNSSFDELNKTITDRDFDWEKILKNSRYFYMCHGSHDPYVSIESAQKMSKKLWVKIDVIENWKHLNSEAGYTEFPRLKKRDK